MQTTVKEGFIAELKRAYRLCQYAPEPSTPEPESETSSNLIIKVTQTPGMATRYQKFYASGTRLNGVDRWLSEWDGWI